MLGRSRYTACTILRRSHLYFFSYVLAKFSNSGCCASINSTVPSRITAFAASSVPITHLGFSAILRALRDMAPVLNQKLSSNHSPQMIIKWGVPSGRAVAIQYCRLFLSRLTAHFHASRSVFFAENSYPGTVGRVALGTLAMKAEPLWVLLWVSPLPFALGFSRFMSASIVCSAIRQHDAHREARLGWDGLQLKLESPS